MLLPSVNLLAVIIAAIANMGIGFVWYSPAVLGKPWMRLMGFSNKTLKQAQSKMKRLYGLSILAAVIQASIISVILQMMYVTSVGNAMVLGGLCWLGFVAVTQFTASLFDTRPFNPHLFSINTGYQLVSILAMTWLLFIFG